MAFQKSAAIIAPEQFDGMNFETRLKAAYESSPVNSLIVAKDGEVPAGYGFSTIVDVKKGDKSGIPERAPDKIGCLNHLYI